MSECVNERGLIEIDVNKRFKRKKRKFVGHLNTTFRHFKFKWDKS